MTCIIGLVDGGTVYMGCDSASYVDVSNRRVTGLRKVFKVGDFLIGYTSSFRMGQILQYHLKVIPQGSEPDEQYLVVAFMEAVRECLKSHGYARVENNMESIGQFLVGYRGRLYQANSDLQINRYVDGFDAVGCGMEYALGAMDALYELPPVDRIERSLRISARFAPGVCEPFSVVSLEAGGEQP